ncbi:uncharacterized protein LOC129795274 [Lutzomyia longipalpis]|uniref:uncharacterized protein LOC129795274 n=1 Tax=Lutzomyia longipalpis TaxID=7200 RepID=UPI0024844C06|nr:uncharacterized protein LOC129795274 [Lutzomyia longipalpis]
MQFSAFLICLAFISSTVHSQTFEISQSIVDVVVPCALETGATEEALGSIDKGDLSSVKNLFGCFTDCVSKKIGVLSEDNNFTVEKFKEKISQFARDDLVDVIVNRCSAKLGSGECQVTGGIYYCIIETLAINFV